MLKWSEKKENNIKDIEISLFCLVIIQPFLNKLIQNKVSLKNTKGFPDFFSSLYIVLVEKLSIKILYDETFFRFISENLCFISLKDNFKEMHS